MEKVGLIRSLDKLSAAKLEVDVLVTDRHPQVQKYVRENRPNIAHFYDPWHITKGQYLNKKSFFMRVLCMAAASIKSLKEH